MSVYRVKRALLRPYIWYMRDKERHQKGFIKAALEAQYYRPTFYRFIGANMVDPEMLHTAPLDRTSVVLDVGAYDGDWAARIVERYDPRIFAFEPDPRSLARLTSRFRGHERVTVFDYGLSNRDATLDLVQAHMGSTLFEGAADAPRSNTVPVRVRDVAAVLDELALGSVDLLKINIEGGEFEVLDRLIERGWMRKVRCLLVQFHEWRAGAHLRRLKIRYHLRRTHEENWNFPFVWEKWTLR